MLPLTLLLVRHAEARNGASGGDDDADRDLSDAGRRDLERVLPRMVAGLPRPDVIVASAARRARATAAALAGVFGPDPVAVVIDEALYLAPAPVLLAAAAERGAGRATVALVAHNPGLSDVYNALARPRLPHRRAGLPPLGIATLRWEATSWQARDAAPVRESRLLNPRDFR